MSNVLVHQLLLAALMVMGAFPEIASTQTANQTQGDYRIGAGDVLDIVVWRNQELTMSVPVRPDGWISLPLVNDVRVAGLTPMQLRETLSEKLEEFISTPNVSVIVTQANSFKVSILGNIRSPGRYQLDGPTTVLDLLAMAGGFVEFSSAEEIYILRPRTETYKRITFKYSVATHAGGKSVNIPLKPGDFIIVP